MCKVSSLCSVFRRKELITEDALMAYLILFVILIGTFVYAGLYWRIHSMDPIQSAILFVLMTGVSTYLLSFAYKNVKFILKHK